VHVIADAGRDLSAIRLTAFAAAADGNWRLLRELLPLLPQACASFLQPLLPSETTANHGLQSPPVSVTPAPNSAVPEQPATHNDVVLSATAGGAYWRELHRAIKGDNTTHTRVLLAALESDMIASPEF